MMTNEEKATLTQDVASEIWSLVKGMLKDSGMKEWEKIKATEMAFCTVLAAHISTFDKEEQNAVIRDINDLVRDMLKTFNKFPMNLN